MTDNLPSDERPTYPTYAEREPYAQPRSEIAEDPLPLISLLLGISAYVFTGVLGAVAAIITGNIALKRAPLGNQRTMAKAGFILGWVSVGLHALVLLAFLLIFGLSALTHTY